MTTTIKLLALVVTLAACGDNLARPDARLGHDGPPADAQCSNCPAPPALGTTQIDRMGRPAINTALNHEFTTTGVTAAKDAYNSDKDIASWAATWAPEFAKNLGIIDVLDGEICGNGLCESGETHATCAADCPGTSDVGSGIGCGNQVAYTAPAATTSYDALAGLLADDELYLDTSKTVCEFYLAVEFGVVTGAGNTTCGGRAPAYDVIDYSYSALAMGIKGFSTDGMFTPQFGDTVPPHTDYLTTFPYLGEPH